MKKTLLTILAGLMLASVSVLYTGCQSKPGTFEIGDGKFLLNGDSFTVKAAEVHYPRIPREYWEHRIEMCKALGMNSICIYIFWNIHEQQEGVYDFTGNNDIRAFCKLAQKHGMYVIVRPGPYVCAEWEMGGLPWWLLKKKDIRLREQDPYFMERVRLFELEVGKQLADLQITRGGNIIMVQVENEYGSYGKDKEYVSAVRDMVREAGFTDVPLFQCDWASNFELNALDDLVWTMNFGTGANIDSQFRRLKELRPNTPLMCSEFWSGWFDNWGRQHETRDAKDMVAGLQEMLDKNISFSLYMTHGGTSFGHWSGANSPGFSPDCSSYDYDAPINEAGQATPKYHELRNMLAQYTDGKPLPEIPAAMPVQTVAEFQMTEVAPIFDNLPEPIHSEEIKTMEEFDQGWGSMLYRTTLKGTDSQSRLTITDAHDYAQVFIDGKYIGKMDRRLGEKVLTLPSVREGAVLDILVEAMGRINFGRAIKDFKGITDRVELTTVAANGEATTTELKGWDVYLFPNTYEFTLNKDYKTTDNGQQTLVPGYYKGSFTVDKKADTFLDLSTWGKGLVYVNGHCLGRFWEIGPQQTLYVPGCWLNKGENEILILDVKGPQENKLCGHEKPILDALRNPVPASHREPGTVLSLKGEKPVLSARFKAGNGWQEQKFAGTLEGQYVCIEVLNNQKANDAYTAIAEWYLLDAEGNRLSREPWTIQYADSEDKSRSNRTGDRIYDLQESTYWATAQGAELPHHLIINLGSKQQLTALQCLPRMEEGAPGAIKEYRIYVKDEPFTIVKE